jgi:hypothetical protein
MDTYLLAPKFNVNLLTRVYGDNLSIGSVRSDGGDNPRPAALFFQHTSPTDHDKYVVELVNHIIRHQNVGTSLLEQLLEHHQTWETTDTDEDTQTVMVSVFTVM